MKRIFNLLLGIVIFGLFAAPMLLISIAVRLSSKGPALYWSDRIGKNNKIFKMPKFRSMLIDTPSVATHLLNNPDSHLSPIGVFLRRSSLDEFPQLFSVLKGDMSFVGPRPALYNQDDLIALRNKNGVDVLMPGITGWAQINGRNSISWDEKFILDIWYVDNFSFWLDIKILLITFKKVIMRQDISKEGVATMSKFQGSNK